MRHDMRPVLIVPQPAQLTLPTLRQRDGRKSGAEAPNVGVSKLQVITVAILAQGLTSGDASAQPLIFVHRV